MKHSKCLRCGRKLKTEQSQELGFGKVCWEKYNTESQMCLFEVNKDACKQQHDDIQTTSSIEQ